MAGRASQHTARAVHAPVERVARGVRMSRELWEFIDDVAEMTGTNASALIEKWAAEKREAVKAVA